MKRGKIISIAASTVLFIGCVVIIAKILSSINEHEQKVDDMIGSEVIYKGDTLMIVNYSLLNSTYGLENGVEINTKLIDDLELISD
jgi:hypothetical protein